MRILEGVGTYVQLSGLLARLCRMVSDFHLLSYWMVLNPIRISEYEARALQNIVKLGVGVDRELIDLIDVGPGCSSSPTSPNWVLVCVAGLEFGSGFIQCAIHELSVVGVSWWA